MARYRRSPSVAIKLGRVPGERRTYEERLRSAIDNLTARVQQGIPIELDRIRTIHFGRMIIVRPEQYLVYSDVPGVQYDETAKGKIPKPIDDYVPLEAAGGKPPTFRSWLLTLVEFDGDIRVYFRDIAQFIADDFDALFRNCEDFGTTRNFEGFWSWIKRYRSQQSLLSRYGTSRWCASSNSRSSSVASTRSSPRCGRQTDHA